ncbi:MAG: PEP/pyruvate-binding domain-containing protein [Promethearchaeota archaeon]
MYTISLSSKEDVSANLVGTKAANLIFLNQKDFPIPDGVVLTINAYKDFIEFNNLTGMINQNLNSYDGKNQLSIKNLSSKIISAIEDGKLQDRLIEQIKLNLDLFNNNPVAIRSSGTLEDLPNSSFAGQYDTYLNIKGLKQILIYVKKCFASLWSERAITYRFNTNLTDKEPEIAVIIQKMVKASISGILFTANPITSDKTELVIESNFGLGESIVSGRVSPDTFTIKRLRKRKGFKILNKKIGFKNLIVNPKSNEIGVEYNEVSDFESNRVSLSDHTIIKLVRIGIDLEKAFQGNPQDVEWVIDEHSKISIVQSRPITSFRHNLDAEDVLWSRGYSDDYWNDNTTPLFFDLLGNHLTKIVNIELNSIMGYREMDFQLLKLFKSHVYFNLNVLRNKVEFEIPTFMRFEDILNYFPNGSGPFGKKTIKNLPFHLKNYLIAQLRVKFHDPDGAMSRTAEAYENWTNEVFNPYLKSFDMKLEKIIKKSDEISLLQLADELDEIMVTHFRLVRYGIPVHNIGMNLLTQYLLNRFLGKEECQKTFPVLISGLEHKLTLTNKSIYKMASIIQESEYLRNIVLNNNSNKIYSILEADSSQIAKDFLSVLNVFLEEYGDRGFTREIYYPRWRESPYLVMDICKSLVRDNCNFSDKSELNNEKQRMIIKSMVETKIKNQKFGMIKWKLFSMILKNSRKYIIFRENQRFNLDKWITRNRSVFLKIAKLLANKKILKEEREIFFIHKLELSNLLNNKYNVSKIEKLKRLINIRLDDFERYENQIPPKFLLGSRQYDDVFPFERDSVILRGIPASHGIITAPVRILNEVNEILSVHSGEILVVPRTDPGWTPIFSKIGGLITETGGILSHGAVVSREYGIPAVTNITNARKLITNGQEITLNGFNGEVTLN